MQKSGEFPGPYVNKPLESDSQIVRQDYDVNEIGARKSAQPKDSRNEMTIKHVEGK